MDSKNIFKRILYYMNPKHIEPKMVKLWAFWIVFWVVLFLVQTGRTRIIAYIHGMI